jgi:membrane protein
MRIVRLLTEAASAAIEHRALDSAAALAYFTLFATFPLMLGLVAASSYFLDSGEIQTRIFRLADDFFPGASSAVRQDISVIIRLRGAMGLVSAIGLLISATAGVAAMTRVINLAWGFEDPGGSAWARTLRKRFQDGGWLRRSIPALPAWLLVRLRDVFLTLLVASLLVFVLALLPTLELLAQSDLAVLGRFREVWAPAFTSFASWAYLVAFFSLIYRLLPYERPPVGATLPGALVAATFVQFAKAGFRWYLAHIADYRAVYGALATAIIMLLWLYCRALLLILGAEFNVALARSRSRESAR